MSTKNEPSKKWQKPRARLFQGEKLPYSLRLPSDLHDYFKEVADKSGRGIADVVADVLDEAAAEWIEQDKPKSRKRGA